MAIKGHRIFGDGKKMKWTKYFIITHRQRDQRRMAYGLYDVGNEKLPSVTTILGATKSEDCEAVYCQLAGEGRHGSSDKN